MFKPFRAIPLLLACLLASSLSASVTMVSSDLFSEVFQDRLTKHLQENGVEVSVTYPGSLRAERSLENGSADIAILAVPDSAERPSEPFIVAPYAFQVVSVVVHSTNPLNEISLPELTGIYGLGGTQQFTTWGQLGVSGNWAQKKISPVAIRKRNSVALELFKAEVLPDRPMADGVRYFEEIDRVLNAVGEDDSVIALVPGTRMTRQTRSLAVSMAKADTSYTPSSDNILFGDYPLRLPFFVAVNPAKATTETLQVIEYLYSDQVAEQMVRAGYSPLSERERENRIADFQRLIGAD